jgi:hypothetical protein
VHDDLSVGRSTRMIVRIYTGPDGQTHFEDLPLPAEGSHNIPLQAGGNLVFPVSLRTIGAIGTPRPGDNTFLFSPGGWKSGSAMAPRAVLGRVMWSSLTTSQARATRRARWEFPGSVPLWRWVPDAVLPPSTYEDIPCHAGHSFALRHREASRHEPGGADRPPGTVTHPAPPGRFRHTRGDCICQSVNA